MKINKIYPWQKKQWQQLWLAKEANRLSHALLLAGISGIGKISFADCFTRASLCKEPPATGEFCDNTCHSCRLISGRVHPNVLWVEPEKSGHAIKVDQIRSASDFTYQSALAGNYRFLIIQPAHLMNANAANALLKTLEEPPSGSIIILISDQSELLPATVQSRCQRIVFSCPDKAEALHWLKAQLGEQSQDLALLLKLANGAPLAARDIAQNGLLALRKELLDLLSLKQLDPIKIAAKVQDIDITQFLDLISTWIIDLLRLQLGGEEDVLINSDYKKQLTELLPSHETKKLVKLMDYIQTIRSQICAGFNLNKQLLIEDVLIHWQS